jgi:hypothetical protein
MARTIHIHQATIGVNDAIDFFDGLFEYTIRRRIGDHKGSQVTLVLLCLFTKIVHIDIAVIITFNDHNFHATH